MNSNNRKLIKFTRRDGAVAFSSGFDSVVGSVLVTSGSDTSTKGPRVSLPAPPPSAAGGGATPEKFHYPNQATIDSSMALTILVLLTAIFFMGFFSIYIRRFASDAAEGPAAEVGSYYRRRNQKKGLDPEVVRSLPAYCYRKGGDGKYDLAECAICLGEFEEEETVKMIPGCQHVFHVQCVDTWLNSHVNCPLCRGTQFLRVVVDDGRSGDGGGGGGGRGISDSRRVEEVEERSMAGSDGTWTVDVGLAGELRRTCSSSSLVRKGEERISLPRTSSF